MQHGIQQQHHVMPPETKLKCIELNGYEETNFVLLFIDDIK